MDPLPDPVQAIAVYDFDCEALLNTGYRLKQACDYTFDGVPDLYVGASVLRDDGSVHDRVLIVDLVTGHLLMDVRSDPTVPDFWDSFDGSECESSDWVGQVLHDDGYDLLDDGDGSSGSSESDGSVLQIAVISSLLYHPNPIVWADRLADFVSISTSARQAANRAYPMDSSMTPSAKEAQQWNRNAMRHALWQGMLTRRFGATTAQAIGDAHEQGSNAPLDTWIDQYNNQVARNIAQQCLAQGCSLEELIQRLLDALDDDRFIKDPCDPRVPVHLRPMDCNGPIGPGQGDVNSDGVINASDLVQTAAAYGSEFITADLNWNGTVDADDISEVATIVADQ